MKKTHKAYFARKIQGGFELWIKSWVDDFSGVAARQVKMGDRSIIRKTKEELVSLVEGDRHWFGNLQFDK